MSCYLVKFVDGYISTFEYEDDKFVPLTNKGERSWSYDPSFWSWFKKKIEYDGEELSFIAISDQEDFCIPLSCEISLSEVNNFDNYDCVDEELKPLCKGLHILSFPQRVQSSVEDISDEEIDTNIDLDDELSENGLASYFRQQTKEYKNG